MHWRLKLTAFFLISAIVAWFSSVSFGFNYLDFINVIGAIKRPHDVLLVGNSVIKATSKCDTDKRSMADMLAASSGRAVFDLSRGGMQLDEELALIKASIVGQSGRRIILPLSVANQLLKKRTPTLGHEAWLARLLHPHALADPQEPQVYKGIRYGSYADFSIKYFPIEKAATTCPEGSVVNQDFVEFMYWLNFTRHNDFSSGQQDWLNQLSEIARSGNQLTVVVFPYHQAMIRTHFGDAQVKRLDAKVGEVVAYLEQSGVRVVDASSVLDATDFTDIWCACGHLNQAGRLKLVELMTQELRRQ